MASRESAAGSRRVPFGERDVGAAEKRPLVARVFTRVAARYDLMNDLMSLGLHRLWRRAALAALRLPADARVLDLAGGTGDMAFRLLGGGRSVVACDINTAMVGQGRHRAWDRGLVRGLAWACGDAEALPFRAAAFDAVTVAFGIRNVTHVDTALSEAARVLKPGGRFVCLEFSPAVAPALLPLYDAWSTRAIPALGGLVTGDRAAYEYLVASIRRFPMPDDLAALLAACGFAGVRARPLSGGIVWLHTGWRV